MWLSSVASCWVNRGADGFGKISTGRSVAGTVSAFAAISVADSADSAASAEAVSSASAVESQVTVVGSRCSSSSRHSLHTSGFITMPAPPPTGVSSTEWCTSCVQSRRLCAVTSTRPFSCALPSRLRLSTSKYSGNTDTISIFIMFHNTGTPAKRGAYEKGAGIIASALLKKQRIRAPE